MDKNDVGGDSHFSPVLTESLPRREFLKLGGLAGLAAGVGLPDAGVAQSVGPAARSEAAAPTDQAYPTVDVAPLSRIEVGKEISFAYPEESSPAVLIRLSHAAEGGVGPDRSIVAYSVLCTHKGCPVSYKADKGLLLCGCHWSSFDPAKAGRMIIGQASEPLPQILLRVNGDVVQAVGVNGLIYGRHTNIK
jgi:arsenite oxidase small subunit